MTFTDYLLSVFFLTLMYCAFKSAWKDAARRFDDPWLDAPVDEEKI
jgi:hypothetical protein